MQTIKHFKQYTADDIAKLFDEVYLNPTRGVEYCITTLFIRAYYPATLEAVRPLNYKTSLPHYFRMVEIYDKRYRENCISNDDLEKLNNYFEECMRYELGRKKIIYRRELLPTINFETLFCWQSLRYPEKRLFKAIKERLEKEVKNASPG